MAIARLFQAGLEFASITYEFTAITGGQMTATTTKAKTGTYSVKTQVFSHGAYKGIDPISQCRASVFINHNGVSAGDSPYIISLLSDTTPIVGLCFDGANLLAYDGSNGDNLLESAAAIPNTDQWYHIGIDVKIDATGWFYAYVDGEEIIGFDGDTTNGGASFNRLYVASQANAAEADAVWGTSLYLDDCYIDSTTGEGAPAVVPSYRFTLLNPNGNGYSSDFNGSDGNQTDNYLLVDEVAPDGDTTYVYHDTTGQNDGYLLENITLAAGESVNAVLPIAIAKKIDAAGSLTLDIGERLGGVNQVSSPSAPGTDYSLLWERHTTKPGGGAWDESDVNTAEFVLETV